MNNKTELLEALAETSRALEPVFQKMEEEQEAFWNSLDEDQQLMAFCAVARRIRKGEIIDRRSYRGMLYDIFGWGPEAYLPAQLAGYMDVHNAIFSSSENEIIDECIAAVENTDRTLAHTTYDLGLINGTIRKSIEALRALQK